MAGTYTKLFYHIVFSTKNRQGFISPSLKEDLHRYMGGIVRGIGGIRVEINGMSDHVHILAILPPKITVSDSLRVIKANSSKWIHETHPELQQFRTGNRFGNTSATKKKAPHAIRL
jgi:putative transposase